MNITKSDEMLREEFEKIYDKTPAFNDIESKKIITDYWLSLLHSRDTAIREEIKKKCESAKHTLVNCDCEGYGCSRNVTIQDIITEVLNK